MRSLADRMQDLEKAVAYLTQWKFLPATSGNISLRYDDRIYITPSGVDKKEINREKMILMDIDGNLLYSSQGLKPSSLPATIRPTLTG